MTLAELERALDAAKERYARASAAMRAQYTDDTRAELGSASDGLLEAERALAIARGDECAVPCPGFPPWDVGAPLPHVLTGSGRAGLVYVAREPVTGWDGTSVHVRSAADEELDTVAVVWFERVAGVRVGAPNDEVIHGHPLHGRGLAPYDAHCIVNSRWKSELQTINSVHSQFNVARWAACNHYFLAFHDEAVECAAHGFRVDVRRTTLAQACRQALEDLMGTGRP
ncbi:MAG: hypothetical protein JWP97_2376 [Labilithrix sp.]|nr:hypothetical protein [Labilithrix sp.]